MNDFNDLAKKIAKANILLVGDIMLDKFIYGAVSRISPEGPIPILTASREVNMLGGTGNVLANLGALGAKSHVISVIGDDLDGQAILRKIEEIQGASHNFVVANDRPTSVKTRYLAKNQQLLRVDNEKTDEIDEKTQENILDHIKRTINDYNAIILSDYGKGVLSPDFIKSLIELANKHQIPVIVDPKGTDFSIYAGAKLVTPNKKELSEATNNMPVETNAEVVNAAQALIKQSNIAHVIATRSEDGISVIQSADKKGTFKEPIHIPTQALEVFDVSGAGDTVVAMIAASVAGGYDLGHAAELANIAGGLAVAKVGTAIVRLEEVMAGLNIVPVNKKSFIAGIYEDVDLASEQVRKWQAQGLKVGFTNGCFDILHYGHVNYLNEAKTKCDRLVMGLNHDNSVRILKGPTRPVNDQQARANVIGALGSVDMVVYFGADKQGEDNTPSPVLGQLKPDILMKGGDYTIDQLPEAKVVLSYGGEVEIMTLYEGYSTTNIIQKARA